MPAFTEGTTHTIDRVDKIQWTIMLLCLFQVDCSTLQMLEAWASVSASPSVPE